MACAVLWSVLMALAGCLSPEVRGRTCLVLVAWVSQAAAKIRNYADRDGPPRKGVASAAQGDGALGRPRNRPALILLWEFRPTAG